jgi:hypothetical protein
MIGRGSLDDGTVRRQKILVRPTRTTLAETVPLLTDEHWHLLEDCKAFRSEKIT